jgi:hypothetical protein
MFVSPYTKSIENKVKKYLKIVIVYSQESNLICDRRIMSFRKNMWTDCYESVHNMSLI